jgi:hypothetical protein
MYVIRVVWYGTYCTDGMYVYLCMYACMHIQLNKNFKTCFIHINKISKNGDQNTLLVNLLLQCQSECVVGVAVFLVQRPANILIEGL